MQDSKKDNLDCTNKETGQMISAVPSGPADDKPMVDDSF